MAVHDIFSEGAKLPDPKKEEGKTMSDESKKDPVEEIEAATHRRNT